MVMYFKTTHNDLIWVTIFRLKEALENSVLPKLFFFCTTTLKSQIERGMNAEFSIGLSNGKFACSEFATK